LQLLMFKLIIKLILILGQLRRPWSGYNIKHQQR
jgi:hypothetical protein